MVSKVSDPQHLAAARAAFHAVFRNPDPFEEPFQARIPERLILYPISYQLDEQEYAAVAAAASAVGELTAFLTLTENSEGLPFEELRHWHIDLGYHPYEALLSTEGWVPFMENAIYSTNGLWGLIISHEDHAVIGGPPRFIEGITRNLPDVGGQIREFLATWKDNRDRLGYEIDWLPRHLTHVYGTERAQSLLAEAGLA